MIVLSIACGKNLQEERRNNERKEKKERSGRSMQITSVLLFLFLYSVLWGGPRGRFIIASVAPSFEFGADRARQRETKAEEIRESEHNWRRDRDRGRNTQRENRRSVGCDLRSTPARECLVRESRALIRLSSFGVIPVGLLGRHEPLPL